MVLRQRPAPELDVDPPEGDRVAQPKPGGFQARANAETDQLAAKLLARLLATSDVHTRRLPQPLEQRAITPRHQHPSSTFDQRDGASLQLDGAPMRSSRQLIHATGRMRPTPASKWTRGTPWRSRRADRSAELHQRLVPVPGLASGDQRLRQLPQRSRPRRLTDRDVHRIQPRQHPRHVAIKHGQRTVETNGEHGRGRVAAHAGKRAKCHGIVRNLSPVFAHETARRLVQVPRAAVVAESRPCGQHLGLANAREDLE